MELSSNEQIFEQIKKSQKILIAVPELFTADALASALALRMFLSKLQKEVVLASSGILPENLGFLPGANNLQAQLKAGKSLVVSLDTSVKKLEEISYQTQSDRVQIYLKAKDVEFAPGDISFSQERFPVDLVFCLGAESLEDLGRLYEQNPDLFFETPKVNIDNQPANEYFGAINLVDITATSVAEILAELLQKYEEHLLDEDIATCLLAGIISATQSFQLVRTTPRSFIKASELVSLGARQQEIIKNIYKTKPLSLLKLWGRALARMKINESSGVVYSLLNAGDFEKAESGEGELLPALKEFIDNLGGYKIFALLAETQKNSTRLILAAHEQVPTDKLLSALGENAELLDYPLGNYRLIRQIAPEASLENLEKRFLEVLRTV